MIINTLKLIIFIFIFTGIGEGCKKKKNDKEEIEIEIIDRDIVGDFYVSVSGDDNNSGTLDSPFKTIKKAIEVTTAGKVVVVLNGNYDEFIKIQKSGTSIDNRITIFSKNKNGAKCRGFRIEGSYVTVDGFEIEMK